MARFIARLRAYPLTDVLEAMRAEVYAKHEREFRIAQTPDDFPDPLDRRVAKWLHNRRIERLAYEAMLATNLSSDHQDLLFPHEHEWYEPFDLDAFRETVAAFAALH